MRSREASILFLHWRILNGGRGCIEFSLRCPTVLGTFVQGIIKATQLRLGVDCCRLSFVWRLSGEEYVFMSRRSRYHETGGRLEMCRPAALPLWAVLQFQGHLLRREIPLGILGLNTWEIVKHNWRDWVIEAHWRRRRKSSRLTSRGLDNMMTRGTNGIQFIFIVHNQCELRYFYLWAVKFHGGGEPRPPFI